jgi:hypothetical protein
MILGHYIQDTSANISSTCYDSISTHSRQWCKKCKSSTLFWKNIYKKSYTIKIHKQSMHTEMKVGNLLLYRDNIIHLPLPVYQKVTYWLMGHLSTISIILSCGFSEYIILPPSTKECLNFIQICMYIHNKNTSW